MGTFYLVSSHGAVVFHIATHPDCTISDIADAMSVTERTIWTLIGDLRREAMVHVRRDGRRHRYRVNLDAPFLHPSLNGYTLNAVVGQMLGSHCRLPIAS